MIGLRWTPDQLAAWQQRQDRLDNVSTATIDDVKPRKRKAVRLAGDRETTIAAYLTMLSLAGVRDPVFEHRFHKTRKWRFDFAWPDIKLAAEYEGGVYSGGAHTRGAHYERDCEKYNEAALAGWRVLRFTVNMVRSGLALQQTERALGRLPEPRGGPLIPGVEF